MSTEACRSLYSEDSKNTQAEEQEGDVHWRSAYNFSDVQEELTLTTDNKYNTNNLHLTNLSNSASTGIVGRNTSEASGTKEKSSPKQRYLDLGEVIGHETYLKPVKLFRSMDKYPMVPEKALCASNFHTVGDACQVGVNIYT